MKINFPANIKKYGPTENRTPGCQIKENFFIKLFCWPLNTKTRLSVLWFSRYRGNRLIKIYLIYFFLSTVLFYEIFC